MKNFTKTILSVFVLLLLAMGANAQVSTTHRKSSNAYRNNFQRVFTSALSSSTFEIRADGTLWAWGSNDGRLGDGTSTPKNSPVQVGSDNKWVSIASGMLHTLAIKSDGTLWAWGDNYFGELGDGSNLTGRSSPVQIGTEIIG